MRKTILVFMMTVLALAAYAQKETIVGVPFGASHDEVLATFRTVFGEPVADKGDMLEFRDVTYEGQKFTSLIVYFDWDQMNHVRFHQVCTGKPQALQKIDSVKETLASKYSISTDYEDEGTRFYKGGLGPDGQSLFTIYTFLDRKNDMKWTAVLRYGAFSL